MGNVFEKMLRDFSQINKQIAKNPTFLEISGYPHYENVCSNILAFFLDPQKEHGLSDLLLRSVFQCLPDASYNLSDSSNVTVEREVGAGAARIDLVINSDSHIIAIENKIFHHADGNPFETYASRINELSRSKNASKNVILIILSLDEKNFHPLAALVGFKSITYPQLFEKIRLNMGDYITRASNKYLVFFLEFIKSIENIYGGNQMDNKLIKFFEKNQDEAEAFFLAFNNFRDELRKMVTDLKNMMTIKEQEGKVLQFPCREPGQLWDSLVADLVVDENLTVVVDCTIAPYGWEIEIYARKDRTDLLKELLNKKGIKLDPKTDGKFSYKSFGFDERIDEVRKQYEDVIERILGQV